MSCLDLRHQTPAEHSGISLAGAVQYQQASSTRDSVVHLARGPELYICALKRIDRFNSNDVTIILTNFINCPTWRSGGPEAVYSTSSVRRSGSGDAPRHIDTVLLQRVYLMLLISTNVAFCFDEHTCECSFSPSAAYATGPSADHRNQVCVSKNSRLDL